MIVVLSTFCEDIDEYIDWIQHTRIIIAAHHHDDWKHIYMGSQQQQMTKKGTREMT